MKTLIAIATASTLLLIALLPQLVPPPSASLPRRAAATPPSPAPAAFEDGVAQVALTGGLISDFDDARMQTLQARTGTWTPTTDALVGGGSTVQLQAVSPGASHSAGALHLHGEIASHSAWPWAGAMYHPGSAPMQAVDARALRELVFFARGDGRRYQVLLFSGESEGARPAMQGFVAASDWHQVRLPLTQFAGIDLGRLRAIAITAGAPEGEFELLVDQFEIR